MNFKTYISLKKYFYFINIFTLNIISIHIISLIIMNIIFIIIVLAILVLILCIYTYTYRRTYTPEHMVISETTNTHKKPLHNTINNSGNIKNKIVKKNTKNIKNLYHEHEHNIIKTVDFKEGEIGYRGNMIQDQLKTNISIESLLE